MRRVPPHFSIPTDNMEMMYYSQKTTFIFSASHASTFLHPNRQHGGDVILMYYSQKPHLFSVRRVPPHFSIPPDNTEVMYYSQTTTFIFSASRASTFLHPTRQHGGDVLFTENHIYFQCVAYPHISPPHQTT